MPFELLEEKHKNNLLKLLRKVKIRQQKQQMPRIWEKLKKSETDWN